MSFKSQEIISGRTVKLRPATAKDRRQIYEWLAQSDITPYATGPPRYPDAPIYTWEEFCDDYKLHYFDDTAPELGRCYVIEVNGVAVGQINYNDVDKENGNIELDIWMSSEANCGKGYGPDAIQAICDYLLDRFGMTEFFMQPSARNPRAVRAYEKAGFRPAGISLDEAEVKYSRRDYVDSVYMVKKLSTR